MASVKRIVTTSDWHGDWSTDGVPRLEHIADAAMASAQYAIDNKADAYLFLGDLMDPDCGQVAFHVLRFAIDVAMTLHEAGIPSLWLPGNHDVIEDGTGATTLDPLTGLARVTGGRVKVLDACCPVDLAGVEVWAFPFTASCRAYDPPARARAMAAMDDGKKPIIAAGHLMLDGIHPGSETTDMPRGRDVKLPLEQLRSGKVKPAVILNGHYHQQQCHDGVWIPGSLERLVHGEEKNVPGWLMVEV